MIVLSPALSATMVSTHRFGRKTLRTLLMMDLSQTFCGSVTHAIHFYELSAVLRRDLNTPLVWSVCCNTWCLFPLPRLRHHGMTTFVVSFKQQPNFQPKVVLLGNVILADILWLAATGHNANRQPTSIGKPDASVLPPVSESENKMLRTRDVLGIVWVCPYMCINT